MKFFTKKSTLQKIMVVMIIIVIASFTLAPYSAVFADGDGDDDGWSIGGTLAKEIMGLFTWVCDVIMGGLNNFMLGANGFGSAMLGQNDPNLTNNKSWLYANYDNVSDGDSRTITFGDGEIDTSLTKWFDAKYAIPNMLYSPENIFANNIATLDINFLRENSYQSIYVEGNSKFEENAKEKSESAAKTLRGTIANWYKSFRNIAIVGLLSVLIYLGIRILLSSTAEDKAKYKQSINDWAVALCLVFFIHFIMSAVLMLTDKCTELFANTVNEGYTVKIPEDSVAFKTNLMGLIRFSAQNHKATTAASYSIIYWALVVYTCMFTVLYFKRFLYMAFFTMIAPLVALTYPIDKAGDGKAQAFNMWFKEYTLNAIIQPVHLILYVVFVGSAYELVAKNPVYALVAIGFLIPAEKFIKKMFGLDKAESTGGFGSFAGGALAMSGLKHLANLGPGGKSKGKASGEKSSDKENINDDIWMPPNEAGDLSSFGNQQGTGNIGGQQGAGNIGGQQGAGNIGGQQGAGNIGGQQGAGNIGGQQRTGNISGQANNQGKNMIKPKRSVTRALGKVAIRGASSAGKQVWNNKGKIARKVAGVATRTGVHAIGAAAGAAVGLAAGITTGDLAKTAQFMGAGALTGSAVTGNLYDGVAKPLVAGAVGVAGEAKNAYNEERFGEEEAIRMQREKQNAKAKKEFMKDENEKKKYKSLANKMKYKGKVEDLMEAASDYREAGVKDETMIQNALQAEYRTGQEVGGKNHKQYVDMASFAHQNGFGKDNIEDEKKRAAFEGVVSSKLANPKDQQKAAQTLAEIFDRGDMYKKVGKLGK